MPDGTQDEVLSDLLEILRQTPENELAWTGLYKRMWPFVFAYCFRRLGYAKPVIEDAAQDVFIRLARYCDFSQLRDTFRFRAYITSIANNVCNRYLTALIIEHRTMIAIDASNIPGKSPTYDDGLLLDETASLLTEEERALFDELRRGGSIEEIAQLWGLSPNTVAVRAYRLRKKLPGIASSL